METKFLTAEFVEFIPPILQGGIAYVSMEYGTVIHSCCCGCGNKVVTPLSPTDWKLIYDGENISLTPSIGNWSFPCQSHYWIKNGKVEWYGKFSKEQIDEVRRKDKYLKSKHFNSIDKPKFLNNTKSAHSTEVRLKSAPTVFRKILDLFR